MKIFYITPRIPYPIDKGDKLRAFYQIKYLSEKHEIFLFAIDENASFNPDNNPLLQYCTKVKVIQLSRPKIIYNLIRGIFRKIPFQTSYYYSKNIAEEVCEAIKQDKPDLIYCQLIRTAELVDGVKNIPKIIDYVDVISKGLERRIEKSNIFLRILLKWELKRAIKYEEKVYNTFNERIIITEEDRDLLPFVNRSNVKIVANGIDLEYYKPLESEKKFDLFFTGNLSYPPNIDAAEFLIKEIMPKVWEKNKNISVAISGASPKKRILSLASEKVKIIGWTDDIRDNYKAAKIFIAPLQIGTGLQNKLLQAMAMKLPCIVSELTARGITKEKPDFMLVAGSAEEFAEYILKLLDDNNFANEVAEKGFQFVTNNYDWKNIITELERIIIEAQYLKG